MNKMIRLSKSKVLCFQQCPYKYFLQNVEKVKIDKIPEQLQKGIEVHKLFEDYNKLCQLGVHMVPDKFSEIMKKFAKHYEIFGKPIYSELKIYNKQLDIVGVIDAVHLDKDKVLVLDYKTGKKHPLKDYRFELALYAYLYEQETNHSVDFVGIYFADAGEFVGEKLDRNEIDKVLEKIKDVKEQIQDCEKLGKWEKNETYLCNWCEMRQNGFCNGE